MGRSTPTPTQHLLETNSLPLTETWNSTLRTRCLEGLWKGFPKGRRYHIHSIPWTQSPAPGAENCCPGTPKVGLKRDQMIHLDVNLHLREEKGRFLSSLHQGEDRSYLEP